MIRKLASIQIITNITPIKNADNLELAIVQGWQSVVKKGEFKIGQKAIFIEIDSILPEIPQFAFMAKDKFRVKTKKLRGCISQGLCFPLTLFNLKEDQYKEGDDLTYLLQIKKYELIDVKLQGDILNRFPGFVPRTDVDRLQSSPELIDHLPNVPLAITTKMDGASCTIYSHKGTFGVCSRNVELKPTDGNIYWQIAHKYSLDEKLKGLNIAIQGELCGPKIQGNKMGLARHKLFIFDIYNIESQEFYSWHELKELTERFDLPMVPVVRENFVTSGNFSMDSWLALAKGKYENGSHQEGIVVRSMREQYISPIGRLRFKIISPDFLLKYDE